MVYLTQQGCVETTPAEMPLVALLQSFWSSLAAKGNPKIDGWKPYTRGLTVAMSQGRTCSLRVRCCGALTMRLYRLDSACHSKMAT